ncbi:MAG: CidA/LrgA family protein [Treponema sp.]|jgi:holin-like protein|nr:CidA/LrgA family protein [Treponema sp.]
MEILRQLGLILAFGFASEVIARYVPVGLPAGVLGILLVLAALGAKILKPEHFGKTADFVSGNMAFFFLPLAVTILQNYESIRPILLLFTGVCIITTVITFAAAYGTVRFLRRLLSGGKGVPFSG